MISFNTPTPAEYSPAQTVIAEVGAVSKGESYSRPHYTKPIVIKNYGPSVTNEPKTGNNDDMGNPYSRETTDANFDTIRAEMGTMKAELNGKMETMITEVRGGFDKLNTRLEDIWKVLIGGLILMVASLVVLAYQNSQQKPAAAAPQQQPVIINMPPPPAATAPPARH